jgi:hypothetical protein
MTTADISNPILNSPYDPPAEYFEIGRQGPTGVVLPGRRPSESFVPVPPSRKGTRGSVDAVGTTPSAVPALHHSSIYLVLAWR